MKQDGRSWALGLAMTLGLMALVLVLLPGPAHTQGSAPTNGLDCKDPPTGERVKLLDDAEIVCALRRSTRKNLEYMKLDYLGYAQDLDRVSLREFHGVDAVSDIRWPAITTADLSGDGIWQPVMAFRDKENRIAVASSRKDPVPVTYWYAEWTHGQGKDLGWVDVAAGNLDRSENGDEEVVLAFRDAYGMLLVAVLDEDDLKTPNASTATYGEDDTNGRSNVHNVSVATGDLDGDGYDNEIVVAFAEKRACAPRPLQVMVFRLSGDRLPELELIWWRAWTDHDRKIGEYTCDRDGRSSFLDVTTGDIDKDYRDEVVLAFRDTTWTGTETEPQTLGFVQILVLDYQGAYKDRDGRTRYQFDDRVWHHSNPWKHLTDDDKPISDVWPAHVSAAAGDIDGDGTDEIVLGYTVAVDRSRFRYFHAYHRLSTYEYVPPEDADWGGCHDDLGADVACLQPSGFWQGPRLSWYAWHDSADAWCRLGLATGDLHRDGTEEIVLARRDPREQGTGMPETAVEVIAFKGDDGLKIYGDIGMHDDASRGEPRAIALAMGDTDATSVYANYTGVCTETNQLHISALIHSPPFWPEDNAREAQAAFGHSLGEGGKDTTTNKVKYGGSVTVGAEFEGIGAGLTTEFEYESASEKAVMTRTVTGFDFETRPVYRDPEDPSWDALAVELCYNMCYYYKDSEHDSTMAVCLPSPTRKCKATSIDLDGWYEDGPAEYGNSWVPVGMNLARDRPAQQSSTPDVGVASRGVDGNTDGDYHHDSVTYAGEGQEPWWQVDLGNSPSVQAVQLWNRTDQVPQWLHDFYVFLSEEPFGEQDTTDEIKGRDGVWWYYHQGTLDGKYEGVAMRLQTIPWDAFQDHGGQAPERSNEVTGRYLRVQLDGGYRNPLSLAEVQVWGLPAKVDQWPKSFDPKAKVNDQPFNVVQPDGTSRTVDGKLVAPWTSSTDPWVQDTGGIGYSFVKETEWSQTHEWGTALTEKAGFEIFGSGAEGIYGRALVTSHEMSWSEETEFSGLAGKVSDRELDYTFRPYVWLQRATSSQSVGQAFLVQDYLVPEIGPEATGAAASSASGAASGPAPQVPLIESPTHPDPDAWYDVNTAIFTWAQPAGDPATVTGYRWYLDRRPETVPSAYSQGVDRTTTYQDLADGVWYLHVRAQGEDGQWGDAAHRAIRVDAHPPRVRLALKPHLPTGQSGWYDGPLTVKVVVSDTAKPGGAVGSGIAAVEVSTDGLAWQSYAPPWRFEANTRGITVWARAADAAGHVSEPVSTTFQIDGLPPDSRTQGGPFPGAWRAEVFTDAQGNEHLALAGTIVDLHAGPAGLDLRAAGTPWASTGAVEALPAPAPGQQEIEANWYFTGTLELGRGNHEFLGAARDHAGNQEDEYEIAHVVWFPQSAPQLGGSGMEARPATVRPGDEVDIFVTVRNRGYQEAWVEVVDTLPQGLAPVTEILADDVVYDAGAQTLTWPARLLWPGEWHRFHFRARVDVGLGATVLENRATAHAFWPNTGELPAAERRRFEDREQTVDLAARVTVDPGLPPSADSTAPWVSLYVHSGQKLVDPEVELGIVAAEDAQWMYVREWMLDPASGEWVVSQNSGWRAYQETTTWTLSPGAGVKYLGVWVADGAWNVSTLDEHSMAFSNLLPGGDTLSDGQRRQYRLELPAGNLAIYNLIAHAGDPDLYVWDPRNAFRPNHAAEGTGLADALGFRPRERGVHLFEVMARGDSEYDLWPARPDTEGPEMPEGAASSDKARPEHPLTVSDPLSAGVGVEAPELEFYQRYLPMVFKGS